MTPEKKSGKFLDPTAEVWLDTHMNNTTNTTATLANIDYLARAHRASIEAFHAAGLAEAAARGDDDAYDEIAAQKVYLAYAVMNEARAAYDDALGFANRQNGN